MANLEELQQMVLNNVVELVEDDVLAQRTVLHHLRQDPFNLNDRQFIKIYRLSKEGARQLIHILEPHLIAPTRTSAVDKTTKVLTALKFYGSGSYQSDIGLNLYSALSQHSVSNCLREVTDVLNLPQIVNRYIHFPMNNNELAVKRREFFDKFNIPCVGVIDCTHIAIVPPSARNVNYPEHLYINRKNYHSINTQLICDANLKIMSINARFPGRTHDAHIWRQSNVKNLLERLHHGENADTSFFLIGDSGYPLWTYLQIPFLNPVPDSPEAAYNAAFKVARCTIERCNGVLKARFRCLLKHRVLHYKPTKASKIINACAVLHNFCVEHNIDLPPADEEDVDFGMFHIDHYVNPRERRNPDLIRGERLRHQLVTNYMRL